MKDIDKKLKEIFDYYDKNNETVIFSSKDACFTLGSTPHIMALISALCNQLKEDIEKELVIQAVDLGYMSQEELAKELKKIVMNNLGVNND